MFRFCLLLDLIMDPKFPKTLKSDSGSRSRAGILTPLHERRKSRGGGGGRGGLSRATARVPAMGKFVLVLPEGSPKSSTRSAGGTIIISLLNWTCHKELHLPKTWFRLAPMSTGNHGVDEKSFCLRLRGGASRLGGKVPI